jgi:hypothetical protein
LTFSIESQGFTLFFEQELSTWIKKTSEIPKNQAETSITASNDVDADLAVPQLGGPAARERPYGRLAVDAPVIGV